MQQIKRVNYHRIITCYRIVSPQLTNSDNIIGKNTYRVLVFNLQSHLNKFSENKLIPK